MKEHVYIVGVNYRDGMFAISKGGYSNIEDAIGFVENRAKGYNKFGLKWENPNTDEDIKEYLIYPITIN
ncbi:MAG: hypothetical protein M0R03_03910 [Novosphingobium sp.]|nr:hypothetical protein [Novosphingobium sp.]